MHTKISDPAPPSLDAITVETKTEGPRAVTLWAFILFTYSINFAFDYETVFCKTLEINPSVFSFYNKLS